LQTEEARDVKKDEGGNPGPPDKTREFITFAGETSIRRGHWNDEAKEGWGKD
jgi:hypothetical protein